LAACRSACKLISPRSDAVDVRTGHLQLSTSCKLHRGYSGDTSSLVVDLICRLPRGETVTRRPPRWARRSASTCLVHLHTTSAVQQSLRHASLAASQSDSLSWPIRPRSVAPGVCGLVMRASSHHVDARFLIISLTKPPDVHFAKFYSEPRGSGAFWTAMWSFAIVWKHWRWSLCPTLISPT
jgi:hypothetical protein